MFGYIRITVTGIFFSSYLNMNLFTHFFLCVPGLYVINASNFVIDGTNLYHSHSFFLSFIYLFVVVISDYCKFLRQQSIVASVLLICKLVKWIKTDFITMYKKEGKNHDDTKYNKKRKNERKWSILKIVVVE